MATSTGQADCLTSGRVGSAATNAGSFLWHFVQMVLAMQVGMLVFHILLCGTFGDNPVLHYAAMDLFMVVPMVALMKYQGHSMRHTGEMVVAMLAGPALVAACVQFGLCAYLPWLPAKTLLTLGDVTMYLGMIGAMLYRRERYLGNHRAVMHTHA